MNLGAVNKEQVAESLRDHNYQDFLASLNLLQRKKGRPIAKSKIVEHFYDFPVADFMVKELTEQRKYIVPMADLYEITYIGPQRDISRPFLSLQRRLHYIGGRLPSGVSFFYDGNIGAAFDVNGFTFNPSEVVLGHRLWLSQNKLVPIQDLADCLYEQTGVPYIRRVYNRMFKLKCKFAESKGKVITPGPYQTGGYMLATDPLILEDYKRNNGRLSPKYAA